MKLTLLLLAAALLMFLIASLVGCTTPEQSQLLPVRFSQL